MRILGASGFFTDGRIRPNTDRRADKVNLKAMKRSHRMSMNCLLTAVLATLLGCAHTNRPEAAWNPRFTPPRSLLSEDRLSEERLAIYRVFLEWFAERNSLACNLSDKTVPLYLTELDPADCVKDADSTSVAQANRVIHRFDGSTLGAPRWNLVDADEQAAKVAANESKEATSDGTKIQERVRQAFILGVLSLSEIADRDQSRC
jgi:hypothetical protein